MVTKNYPKLSLLLLLVLLLLSSGALLLGPAASLGQNNHAYLWLIITQLRLPRLLAAWLVGSSLATFGVTSQRLFHNHLASPDILGISASASLGAFISLQFFPHQRLFWLSFGFGLATLIPFLLLSRRANAIYFLLSGLAVNALASGLLAFFITLTDTQTLQQYIFWSLGSLHLVSLTSVLTTAPLLLMISVLLWLSHRQLDLLLFGDTWAATRGVNLITFRLLLASLIAAGLALCIALVGPIGFIALLAPHIAKLLFPAQHALLIPAAALIGALLLVISDTAARLLFLPYELKAGILLNIIGGGYFIFLLLRQESIHE